MAEAEDKGSASTQAAVEEAVRVLEAGRVVALPTETVYGLCARASHPEAVDEIYALKGRPPEKQLPFLLPSAGSASAFANVIPPRAWRLAAAFWPGPLTIVLGPEPGVALRVPDHPLTLEVLKRAAGPVFGTSANPSGKEEARTAEEVRAYFPDLACVLDGGRGRIGVASSVVRIAESGAIRVLREGAVPKEEILEAAPWSILCVCTGNTCRSPMAAALFRHELAQESGVATDALEAAGFRIGSAGLSAPVGAPVSRDALAVLLGRGVQGGPEHRSRRLDAALVEEADLVYVMTRAHKEQLVAFHPEARSRTHLLDPDGRDIEDPYGGSPRDYRECFRVLRTAIRKRVRAVLLPPSAGSSG